MRLIERRLSERRLDGLAHLHPWMEQGRLYAVVDACGVPAIPPHTRELGPARACSLFDGTASADYWALAPHLWKLSPEILAWLTSQAWNGPWGIFVVSASPFPAVAKHLGALAAVTGADGRQTYLRFHDPRVLPKYLPTCPEDQLGKIFGPIARFIIPGPTPDAPLSALSCLEPETGKKEPPLRIIAARRPR